MPVKEPAAVLANPEKFYEKLNIKQEAIKSLGEQGALDVCTNTLNSIKPSALDTCKNILSKIKPGALSTSGAAAAGAAQLATIPAIAAIIGSKTGILGFIGIGVATVSISQIAIIGLSAGIATYTGIMVYDKMTGKVKVDDTIELPEFIKTSQDLLADGVFMQIAPFCLGLCYADGQFSKDERDLFKAHFVNEWGYTAEYFDFTISRMESEGEQKMPLKYRQKFFQDYVQKNDDKGAFILALRLISILYDLALSDGKITPKEREFIKTVADGFE